MPLRSFSASRGPRSSTRARVYSPRLLAAQRYGAKTIGFARTDVNMQALANSTKEDFESVRLEQRHAISLSRLTVPTVQPRARQPASERPSCRWV